MRARHLLAVLLVSILANQSFGASSVSTATVTVNIAVQPFAQLNLPQGASFTLRVPNTPHCAPNRERDWDYWKGIGDSKHKKGKNDRDDWDGWSDADWNRWGANHDWDDWGDFDHPDWKHDGWYARCKRWLSDWYWPVIRPVRIPFTVTGNTAASVSVKPGQYLRIKSGKYLGKATAPGNLGLGYDVVVHFPAPDRRYSWIPGWDFYDDWLDWRRWGGFGALPGWSKWARLPGSNGTGTPPLTANLAQMNNEAYGVLYIVARRDWTTSGQRAAPGDYLGSVVITVTAD